MVFADGSTVGAHGADALATVDVTATGVLTGSANVTANVSTTAFDAVAGNNTATDSDTPAQTLAFSLVGRQTPLVMIVSRILLIPVIAAVGYELLRFGARHPLGRRCGGLMIRRRGPNGGAAPEN